MARIVSRGFACEHRLYALLDGSAALRGAVIEFFPDAVVQLCLVHKERNIRSKLSKRHWGELSRLFTRLRKVQGYASALERVGNFQPVQGEKILASFVKALKCFRIDGLKEHFHLTKDLHRALLSTNGIENAFRNTRRKLGRVTRFRAETDQASRWMSYALLEAEKGFRRITGHQSLKHLVAALQRPVDKPA